MVIIIEIGNPIHQNTLKRIIQNPKYKGYYTGGISTVVDYRSKKRNFNEKDKWKVFKDYEKVPPIVSEELWEKANQKLLNRSKSAKMYKKHQTKYPLSGKIYCEKHKCGFVRKIRRYKNKPDEVYWYCSTFHKSGRKTCVPACFKEKDLYNILLSIFKTYEIYKEEICEELLDFYNTHSKTEKNINQEIRLQNELIKLKKRKEKLLDFALDGLLSKEDLKTKKLIIEKQIEQINSKLKELQEKKKTTEELKNGTLKDNILNELEISNDNLEIYIEELIDKIIILKKENEQDSNKPNIELKIILEGNKIVSYCISTKN